jgi:hypothetical protein
MCSTKLQSQKFDPALIYGGLLSFLVFTKKQKDQDQSAQGHDMYRDWYRKNVMCEDALDSNILFSKLFAHQILFVTLFGTVLHSRVPQAHMG